MLTVRLSFPTTFQALDALTTICKEIEAGADQLVAEHSKKRNQFLSIHQLPPEVAVTVISTALSSDEYSRKNHTTTYLHRQKELRLVCARWNELIKATPRLWAIVTCADVYQNRLQMAIRLSGTTALDITCCANTKPKPRCRSFEAEMGKLVHRWGSLDVRGSLWIDNPISLVSELLVLRLHGTTDFFSMSPRPCGFLGGAVAKLREICLDDFMVPWEWPTLPSLTHLELRKIREGPTAAQVLAIISRAPRLKSWIIHQVRIQPLGETASEGPPIESTQLRNVQFDSVRLDSVVQILKNLQLSRGCVIEVVAKNHDSSFRPFLDYVRRRLPEIEDANRKWTTSVSVDITLSPEIILAFPHHEWELRFTLIDQRWADDEVKWQAYRHVLEEARSGFLHVDGDPGINLWTMFRSISDTLKRIVGTT
ncbi:hypothetical protein FRC00_004791 [Tulasnella sp. 408]|nr:hypothetical protein FRC00_004791 [Tulasnella sp. 408]